MHPQTFVRADLTDRTDVELLVRTFYLRAFHDDLIGTIFVDVAQLDLAAHLPVMCDFWETVLFRAGLYRRNAFNVHGEVDARFRLHVEHFLRWLELWTSTVDTLFAGEKAERAKVQAARIAWSMSRRLNGDAASQPLAIARKPVRAERERAITPATN